MMKKNDNSPGVPRISVIVPLYNERDNARELYRRITTALGTGGDHEVILVNDGSTDGTREVLEELCREDSKLRVVQLRRNFGQTAAIMAGMDVARGDIIVPMDGDLQNDPADIPRLVAELDKGFEVCSGWRRDRKDNLLRRVLPSRAANLLISWISGVRLHDYGCTLKAYRREVIKTVRLYGEMHRFIPIYAAWQGARVTELPVTHHPRIHGKSKYGLERTIKVILDLIVLKFLADYSQKPIYVFGGFGLLSMFGSFLCFALMIYYKYWGGKSFIATPLPSLVIMLFLMGFVSILMGLIAELVMRTYYESQGKKTYVVDETVESPRDAERN